MIWYRTAAGKLTTVKIPAVKKSEAIRKFKKTVRDTTPFRVLKLKSKTHTAPKKRRKKGRARTMGKCSRKPESTDPASEMFGKRRRKKRRKLSGENHKDVFIHGRKKKRKNRRKSRRMAGYKKSTGRDLILVPGDKSKADLQKDKLKNNIIIYGNRKGGRKMPKLKGDIVKILMAGMTGAAGGIAGNLAGKYIPVPEQFKPLLPIVLGVAVNYAPIKNAEMKKAISIGLITIGTIAALKKYFPQLTFLEGQDEITDADLDLLGLSDRSDPAPANELDDIFGEVVDVAGEVITMGDDWITPADTN